MRCCGGLQHAQPGVELLNSRALYMQEGPAMTPCRCECTTKNISYAVLLARGRREDSGQHTGLGLTWMSLGSGSHHRPTPLSCDAWSSPWTVYCPKTPTWRSVGVCPLRATGLVLLYCCV